MSIELYQDELLKQMPKGIFLNVKDGDNINTMTIGWGSVGIVWGKPVLMVMVRPSRYTYDLMEKTDEFTVSVPKYDTMKKELSFCGSKSGRDVDKFKECSLGITEGRKIKTPVIDDCEIFYECRILYKDILKAEKIDENIMDRCYPSDDLHMLYYGQIIESYKK